MAIPGKTIDFVIIGAAKAGTSSLASWLGSHPDVCMSNPKETMFFGSPKLFNRGLDYFHSEYFTHYQGERLIGDATPAYSDRNRHPDTAERVFRINPNAKIIYIVRNPLRKVESSWQMHCNLTADPNHTEEDKLYCEMAHEGFSTYISNPTLFEHFVEVCSYQYQLSEWQQWFNQTQIHVMFLEDLAQNRDIELSRLSKALELDPKPLLENALKPENTLSQRRKQRRIVSYLSKLKLHKALPASIKTKLSTSRLLSVPHSSILKPIWPKPILTRFIEAIQPDIQNFLQANGKHDSFYLLNIQNEDQK